MTATIRACTRAGKPPALFRTEALNSRQLACARRCGRSTPAAPGKVTAAVAEFGKLVLGFQLLAVFQDSLAVTPVQE